MADDTKPMTFHLPNKLRERLRIIAERERRSLTAQMLVLLEDGAARREAEIDSENV